MHIGYRHFYVKTAKDLKFHTRALERHSLCRLAVEVSFMLGFFAIRK